VSHFRGYMDAYRAVVDILRPAKVQISIENGIYFLRLHTYQLAEVRVVSESATDTKESFILVWGLPETKPYETEYV